MIVGESLWGVINATIIWATNKAAPLQLAPDNFVWVNWISTALFAALIVILYGWIMGRAKAHRPQSTPYSVIPLPSAQRGEGSQGTRSSVPDPLRFPSLASLGQE